MLHLFVPREDALFEPAEGRTVSLERKSWIFRNGHLPEIVSKPLVKIPLNESGGLVYTPASRLSINAITDRIKGKHSGVRSGLLFDNGTMYKLKGCVPTAEDYHGEPFGGQVLSRVEQEIDATRELSRLLVGQGLPPVYKTLGHFKYPLTFKGEPLACSIMEAKGDTRLDELVSALETPIAVAYKIDGKVKFPQYVSELGNVFYKLGQWAGWLKRIMDDNNMPWSLSCTTGGRVNTHIGNYVVFGDNGGILLGCVDLDDCHFPYDDGGLRQQEYDLLIATMLDPGVTSMNLGIKIQDGIEYPLDYRYRFVEGFESGYMNADATRIHPAEIEEARTATLRASDKLKEEAAMIAKARERRLTRVFRDSSIYLKNLADPYYGKDIRSNDIRFSNYGIGESELEKIIGQYDSPQGNAIVNYKITK